MDTEKEWVFDIKDYEGTSVVLNWVTWKSKAGNNGEGIHPEIRDYLEEVRKTIEAPDLVFKSTRDERSRVFYGFNIGRGDFVGKHLAVVIKYIDEISGRRGYVSTIYISRTVYSKGEQLWPKKTNQT